MKNNLRSFVVVVAMMVVLLLWMGMVSRNYVACKQRCKEREWGGVRCYGGLVTRRLKDFFL